MLLLLLGFIAHFQRLLSSNQRELWMHCTTVSLLINAGVSLAFLSDPLLDAGSRFVARTSTGLAVGWLVLITEVVLPEYQRWHDLVADLGKRLLEEGGKKLDVKPPFRERQQGATPSHLFLSHKWTTGQDQVQSIYPTLKLMVPSLQIWLDTGIIIYDIIL